MGRIIGGWGRNRTGQFKPLNKGLMVLLPNCFGKLAIVFLRQSKDRVSQISGAKEYSSCDAMIFGVIGHLWNEIRLTNLRRTLNSVCLLSK